MENMTATASGIDYAKRNQQTFVAEFTEYQAPEELNFEMIRKAVKELSGIHPSMVMYSEFAGKDWITQEYNRKGDKNRMYVYTVTIVNPRDEVFDIVTVVAKSVTNATIKGLADSEFAGWNVDELAINVEEVMYFDKKGE